MTFISVLSNFAAQFKNLNTMKNYLEIHKSLIDRQRAISAERDAFTEEVEPLFAKCCASNLGAKIKIDGKPQTIVGIEVTVLIDKAKVILLVDKAKDSHLALSPENAQAYKRYLSGKINAIECFNAQNFDDDQPYAIDATVTYVPMEKVIEGIEGKAAIQFT